MKTWKRAGCAIFTAIALVLGACGGSQSGGSITGGEIGGGDSPPAANGPAEFVAAIDSKAVSLYDVQGAVPTLASTTEFPGIPGTYSRAGNTVTVRMPNHNIRNGLWVPLKFAPGTGGTATSGTYKVTVVDAHSFTVTDAATGEITNGTVMRDPVTVLSGTYLQEGTVVTVTIPSHGLVGGFDAVDLKFTSGGAADLSGQVGVPTADTLTLNAPAGSGSGSVDVYIGTNYTAFDQAMHPSGKWLYVSSGYDCTVGHPYCWGGDVITQYAIDWDARKLTAVDSQRSRGAVAGQPTPVPVTIAINPAGTHLAHQDDDQDMLVLWSIDQDTGRLTHLAESAVGSTNGHGTVFSADGAYVYNGSAVFKVDTRTAPSITLIRDADQWSASARIWNKFLFVSQQQDAVLHAYSLGDPASPSLVFSQGGVVTDRDIAVSNSGALLVTSGKGGIKTYTFSGSAIAAALPASGSAEMQRDATSTLATGPGTIMYRSVSLNEAGNLAVSAYFTPRQTSNKRTPSGVFFARVTEDGGLTHVKDLPGAQYARAARFIRNPSQ